MALPYNNVQHVVKIAQDSYVVQHMPPPVNPRKDQMKPCLHMHLPYRRLSPSGRCLSEAYCAASILERRRRWRPVSRAFHTTQSFLIKAPHKDPPQIRAPPPNLQLQRTLHRDIPVPPPANYVNVPTDGPNDEQRTTRNPQTDTPSNPHPSATRLTPQRTPRTPHPPPKRRPHRTRPAPRRKARPRPPQARPRPPPPPPPPASSQQCPPPARSPSTRSTAPPRTSSRSRSATRAPTAWAATCTPTTRSCAGRTSRPSSCGSRRCGGGTPTSSTLGISWRGRARGSRYRRCRARCLRIGSATMSLRGGGRGWRSS